MWLAPRVRSSPLSFAHPHGNTPAPGPETHVRKPRYSPLSRFVSILLPARLKPLTARHLGPAPENLFDRHVGVEHQVEEAHHHLVPALVAPAHFLRRIGIIGIVR